jgi:hypothetical protein
MERFYGESDAREMIRMGRGLLGARTAGSHRAFGSLRNDKELVMSIGQRCIKGNPHFSQKTREMGHPAWAKARIILEALRGA